MGEHVFDAFTVPAKSRVAFNIWFSRDGVSKSAFGLTDSLDSPGGKGFLARHEEKLKLERRGSDVYDEDSHGGGMWQLSG
jgi:hypothetical protein